MSRTRIFIFLAALVGLSWLFFPALAALVSGKTDLKDLGQLGDTYGGLNSLFSGLAFAGLVAALLLQHHEIEATQRAVREAEESRKREFDTESFLRVTDFMEQTRQARSLVRGLIKGNRTWETLDRETELPVVDDLCRAFDRLGMLDRLQLIDTRLVDFFYSVPFVELYSQYLRNYVADLRSDEKRGPTHFWELVQFYDRVQHVPEGHPAKTGDPKWPDDPRRPRPAHRLPGTPLG